MARGISQSALAKAAGVSRTLLNQLECGLLSDVSVSKLRALLEQVELTITLGAYPSREMDYIAMACTTVSVGYKDPLTEHELIRSLLTGKVPSGKRAHVRTLLEEAPKSLVDGLIEQVGRWAKPGRVRRNVASLTHQLASSRKSHG